MPTDQDYIRLGIRLARRGLGATSPNPIVGAVLVRRGQIIGCGWHHRAGEPHAEIEALSDARSRGHNSKGSTLYVTLEPCCTHGRTPPCTEAIIKAGIRRLVAGAKDPNPLHCGKGLSILQHAGVKVLQGVLERDCANLNYAFNHWIVHHTPFVTVKSAMTLDGKIATASGHSKWITGEQARAWGMRLRQETDAILVGINTILADDPSLTWRRGARGAANNKHQLRRIILDTRARTPLTSKVVADANASQTTLVVGELAPARRVSALSKRVRVLVAPLVIVGEPGSRTEARAKLDLGWLLRTLGSEQVTSLLVEGGGEVNASFLLQGLANRIAFFYAPKVLGGRDSRPALAGEGVFSLKNAIELSDIAWRRVGSDWLLMASVEPQNREA